jgi:polysaccharide pyruvyl transferase WcaK-like protein/predicted O-methyltransferase YrrM
VAGRRRIGIVGTFDVENFGDVLFPLLTAQALERRLDDLEIVRYSYRDKTADEWPYEVRSLVHLARDLPQLDLVLVGAGHLIRLDKDVAPGYLPPPGLHHPTGFWLLPTLLAAAGGVPVAWSSVTVSEKTPRWAVDLLALAVRSAAYVAVRDEPSLRELARVGGDGAAILIPDIAFGIGSLLREHPSSELERFYEDTGLTEPYVVVQPSPHLQPHAAQVDAALRVARSAGRRILEVPISPVLGDRVGLLGLEVETVQPASWPHPHLLAEIVSRADAVVARSLHLSVVALATGVPVHRHSSDPLAKYAPLDGFPGVHFWSDDADVAETMRHGLGSGEPDPLVAEHLAALDVHWDEVARLASEGSDGGAGVAAELISLTTARLEGLAAEEARLERLVSSHEHAEFVPPGHFYSAIPAFDELEGREAEIFGRDPREIAGIDLRLDAQVALTDELAPLLAEVPFADDPVEGLRYHFANGVFDRADGLFLHLMLRCFRPAHVIEIGSGFSSACILDTVERFIPATRCTFVDPYREVLDSVLRPSDHERLEILAEPVQSVDLAVFWKLEPGDLLFVDSTHVAKTGSDVNYLLFDVLPALRPGVLIHFHDIFPGFEYPIDWLREHRAWSESYLLRAFLQFNDAFEIVLWPSLLARVRPDAFANVAGPLANTGGSIYLRRAS